MIDINFQGVYDVIMDTLPDEWEEIILHCLSWNGSHEISYYVKSRGGSIRDCYMLGIPDDVILNKSLKLLSLVLEGEHSWRALTVIIDADGSFDAHADYTSNINDVKKYMEVWSEKYLR